MLNCCNGSLSKKTDMPAYLALFLCYAFIAWLLRRDMQWRSAGSAALLIPAVWIGIIGSRPVTYWLGPVRPGSNLEGSAVNTLVLGALMVASLIVLARRNVSWGELLQRNKALFLIYGFFVISASWSELPGASFKRVVKDFGCVLAALVVLTEKDPMQALRATMVRVAYVLFPLSIVFIKYFPHIGRQFTRAGDPMCTGVTIQKNSLGEMLFVFLLVIIWDLIVIWKQQQPLSKAAKLQKWIHMGMIFLGSWLLLMSDSKTSQVCFVIGLLTLWATGRLIRMRNGNQVLTAGLVILIGLGSLDKTFHLSEAVIRALGRNPNLTGRTEIWKAIMDEKPDHGIGEGFYIFWDTEKGKRVVDALITVSSAHQGYLEVYIDGGVVGCVLLGVLLISGFLRIRHRLFKNQPIGRIGLAIWATALVYNLSESSFFRLDPLWFVLLLVLLETPQRTVISQPVRVHTPQREPARVAQAVH